MKLTSELRIFNDARVTVISESNKVSQDGERPVGKGVGRKRVMVNKKQTFFN